MFIDIHILQTVPFSNLNRDDKGTPKTVVYGGAQRARVSSQSWKRATRTQLEQLIPAATTYRTRLPDKRLAEILESADGGAIDAEQAEKIALGVFRALGTKKAKDVVAIFSEQELQALVPVAIEHTDKLVALALTEAKDASKVDAELKKALTAVVSVRRPTTVALFGRMIADNTAVNVDAAMQVAHAFSIDEIDIEDDFFTAVEELVDEADSMGSAHMDNAEFVSATFYRYATLDFNELVANSGGDVELATELATAGIKAFCLSLPTGKNNVTAPHTVPDLVHITVNKSRPISFAGAFEKPVRARNESPAFEGAKILGTYSQRISRMVTEADDPFGVVSMLDDEVVADLGQNYAEGGGLDKLITAAVESVAGSASAA